MKTLKYILVLQFFIGIGLGLVQAQEFDFGDEKIQLFSDRSLFISGEEINFAAFMDNKHDQSKILYIELILPDGKALVSQKHSISDNLSQGKLNIPQDLMSGIYYLKAYTKYMRNFGPESFAYLPLKIINPYSDTFLGGGDTLSNAPIFPADLPIKQGLSNKQDLYTIQFSEQELKDLIKFSVSIVPANSFSTYANISKVNKANSGKFFPETRGISLSGQLVDSAEQKPLPFREITLSIIDQKNFIPTRSGADGKFYFSLPNISGNHDVFISTKREEGITPVILADKDFDTEALSLPSPPFILSEEERKTALKIAQSFQILTNYFKINTEHRLDTFNIPFYGKPTNTLYLDEFIKLQTLEEYFTELPGLVYINNQKKTKSFAIKSPLRDMSMYPPLVLIDWVAVEDANRILSLSPQGIEKVDIVTFPYVYGSYIYGGIISIRSRNDDFGGISLPKTGLFFNFDFIQPTSNYLKIGDSNRIPDVRNTLYWEVFTLQENSSLEIDFVKKSSKQNYWLIVQGIDKEGESRRQVYSLELK